MEIATSNIRLVPVRYFLFGASLIRRYFVLIGIHTFSWSKTRATFQLCVRLQWNLPKADILQSGHLSKTDKKFSPGRIPKESLITKPLQSGHFFQVPHEHLNHNRPP